MCLEERKSPAARAGLSGACLAWGDTTIAAFPTALGGLQQPVANLATLFPSVNQRRPGARPIPAAPARRPCFSHVALGFVHAESPPFPRPASRLSLRGIATQPQPLNAASAPLACAGLPPLERVESPSVRQSIGACAESPPLAAMPPRDRPLPGALPQVRVPLLARARIHYPLICGAGLPLRLRALPGHACAASDRRRLARICHPLLLPLPGKSRLGRCAELPPAAFGLLC